MRPVVGVMPLWDDEKQKIWMLPGYLNRLTEAGCVPVIFPLTADEEALKQLVSTVDGLMFTGGHDVSPDIYGETVLNDSVVCCRMRDDMEKIVLKEALKQEKSILAFCRGLQFINASLGGTLYQDIPAQCSSTLIHSQKKPYDIPAHTVKLLKGAPLNILLGMEELPVNSTHHQAVKTAAPGLLPMAIAPDGITEGLYMPDYKFLWAVQWHPEMLSQKDEPSKMLFKAFADSMK